MHTFNSRLNYVQKHSFISSHHQRNVHGQVFRLLCLGFTVLLLPAPSDLLPCPRVP